MAATERHLNLCLPTTIQAGRKHATQCTSLVHADVLRIAPQRQPAKCKVGLLLGCLDLVSLSKKNRELRWRETRGG